MPVSRVNKTLARIVPRARPVLAAEVDQAPWDRESRAGITRVPRRRGPRGQSGPKGKAPAMPGPPWGADRARLPGVANPAVHVAAVEAERRVQAVRDHAGGGVHEDRLLRVLVQHVVRAQGEGPAGGRAEAHRGV